MSSSESLPTEADVTGSSVRDVKHTGSAVVAGVKLALVNGCLAPVTGKIERTCAPEVADVAPALATVQTWRADTVIVELTEGAVVAGAAITEGRGGVRHARAVVPALHVVAVVVGLTQLSHVPVHTLAREVGVADVRHARASVEAWVGRAHPPQFASLAEEVPRTLAPECTQQVRAGPVV